MLAETVPSWRWIIQFKSKWDSTECRMIISNVRGEGGSRQGASCHTHAQLRHEARDEAGRKDYRSPGTGRSSLFLPYSRREDRGSGIDSLLVRFPSLPIRYTTSRKTSMDFGFRQKHWHLLIFNYNQVNKYSLSDISVKVAIYFYINHKYSTICCTKINLW